MEPFIKHTGLVAPLDRVNVDTDQMVPKQFLKLQTRQGYGRVLFYDWRYLPGEKPNPEFVLNAPRYKGASVILARILTAFSSVFLDEFAPRFSIATLTAVTRPLSESKPKVAGKEAHSAASSFSRRTTSVLAFRNLSTFH